MEENQAVVQVGESATPEQQKSFTQEEVNRLIGREKAKAAEHARREAEERFNSSQASADATRAIGMQQEQRNAQVSREVDADALTKQVMDNLQKEFQEKQLKAQMEQVANNYLQKVAEGKKSYQDFEEVTKDFDPTAFPQLTFLLSGIENAGDVLYDLSKNPGKLGQIDYMAQRSPKMAQAQLLSLAKSIADNRQAQAEVQPIPAPLDRMNASRVAGNNGKMSIRDLRNQSWLRG